MDQMDYGAVLPPSLMVFFQPAGDLFVTINAPKKTQKRTARSPGSATFISWVHLL